MSFRRAAGEKILCIKVAYKYKSSHNRVDFKAYASR